MVARCTLLSVAAISHLQKSTTRRPERRRAAIHCADRAGDLLPDYCPLRAVPRAAHGAHRQLLDHQCVAHFPGARCHYLLMPIQYAAVSTAGPLPVHALPVQHLPKSTCDKHHPPCLRVLSCAPASHVYWLPVSQALCHRRLHKVSLFESCVVCSKASGSWS